MQLVLLQRGRAARAKVKDLRDAGADKEAIRKAEVGLYKTRIQLTQALETAWLQPLSLPLDPS
jgi:hypothetical protein